MAWERDVVLKSDHELEIMQAAGRINAMALEAVHEAIRPGVTTQELDAIAEQVIRDNGAKPAFLNYPGPYPYPGTINASINEEMVHGIPSKREVREGDIISIDCGTIYEGFVADSAFTTGVGEVSAEKQKLMDVTKRSLELGIEKMCPGNRIGDVASTVQRYVEGQGFFVPREYTGHGVGRKLHEGPQLPNYGMPGRGMVLRKGMTIAIEPMVLVGTFRTKVLPDKWTVTAADDSMTAHFEHSVAITDNGPLILTVNRKD
ncbi:MAG: type I methionyl aminopeptidase [Anaerolineales bacterium]|nr:type I methionyl aminopeptidase [Anaerolineales bacterium]